MKYDYTCFVPPDRSLKWIRRSIITIEIFGPKDSKEFDALIDSGADNALFNEEIAELLGIDLSRAKPVKLTGISGQLDGRRLEDVKIKLKNFDEAVKIPICFVKSPTVGVLLGQEGFFDKYRIKFEKDHNSFEVNTVKK